MSTEFCFANCRGDGLSVLSLTFDQLAAACSFSVLFLLAPYELCQLRNETHAIQRSRHLRYRKLKNPTP